MNKLNKLGLTALAGTLVTLSAAQAGGVSVNGTMELSWKDLPSNEVTGVPIGMNKNLSFSGSGEFSNGWTFGILHVMNDTMTGQSSSSLNINMGGILTLAYDSGTGGYGANAVDNVVPTAWEEVDYGFATGLSDVGAVTKTHGVMNMTLKAPVSGTALSISYAPRFGNTAIADGGTSGSHATGEFGMDAVLDLWNINSKYIGLRTGAAAEKVSHQNCATTKSAENINGNCSGQKGHAYAATIYQTVRLGPLSAGFQGTYKDPGTAGGVENNQAWVAGAALTLGKYASLSYGKGYDRYYHSGGVAAGGSHDTDDASSSEVDLQHVAAKYHGWSAAINIGPIALKGVVNRVQNEGGAHNSLIEHSNGQRRSEVNLSMAF